MWKIYRMETETTVLYPKTAYSLSWAPLGGGFPKKLRAVVNLTCDPDARHQSIINQARLARARIADSLGVKPREIAVMITAVPQIAGTVLCRRHQRTGLEVRVFCTVGLGNSVSAGAPPTFDEETTINVPEKPGTVNVIVSVNRPLTRPAMLEAANNAVIGKATAVATQQLTAPDGTPKLATGTDCITLSTVATDSSPTLRFAGLHTVLGQLIASTVKEACLSCLNKRVK